MSEEISPIPSEVKTSSEIGRSSSPTSPPQAKSSTAAPTPSSPTHSPKRSVSKNATVPTSPVSPTTPKRRKMKKRVYVFVAFLVALVFYSVYSEGRVGVIASAKSIGLLIFLWLSVWHLFLKNVKVFQTLASVIFQVTEDADKRPRAPRRVVVYE